MITSIIWTLRLYAPQYHCSQIAITLTQSAYYQTPCYVTHSLMSSIIWTLRLYAPQYHCSQIAITLTQSAYYQTPCYVTHSLMSDRPRFIDGLEHFYEVLFIYRTVYEVLIIYLTDCHSFSSTTNRIWGWQFWVWPTKVHRWVRTLLQGSRLLPTLYEAVVIYPEYWALSATLEVLQHGDFIAVCPGTSTVTAFNIEFVVTITEISTNSTLNNGQAYIHIYYPAY
jgi:hypothetical protein